MQTIKPLASSKSIIHVPLKIYVSVLTEQSDLKIMVNTIMEGSSVHLHLHAPNPLSNHNGSIKIDKIDDVKMFYLTASMKLWT